MVDKLGPSSKQELPVDTEASPKSRVERLFQASIALKQQVVDGQADTIVRIAEALFRSFRQGGKVLLCGNGGSAADAQHLATELLVRLRPHMNRQGLPTLALATDTSSLTAYSNDYSFEGYYERMTRALGRAGDVLVGISTSGRSTNVVRALRAAREMQMVAVGFLGGDGGPALAECQLALIVPSTVTGRVQEAHITVGHAVMELVEDMLTESGHLSLE